MSSSQNLKNNSGVNQGTKINNKGTKPNNQGNKSNKSNGNQGNKVNNLFSLPNNNTTNNGTTNNDLVNTPNIKNVNVTPNNTGNSTNTSTSTSNSTKNGNTSNTNSNKKGIFSSATDYYNQATGNETFMVIFKVILGVIFVVILINIVKYFYIKWANEKTGSPLLVEGTKNGKQAMVISQDPNHSNYIPINRSVNKEGIEFSYSYWFVISDLTYKQGEWKHIFHKGNSTSYPNRAPGVWIHPNNNIIRVYMNTLKEILEYVDIDNIPLRKWVHMSVIVKNRSLSIYINGFLKIRKELSSLPRQNYGNVWVNLFGGFDGYVSQLQYFDHALEAADVQSAVSAGPAQGSCIDTKEKPPYLDDSWWLN
jgi:hypothetical protein